MDRSTADAASHFRSRSFAWTVRCDDPRLRRRIDDAFADLVHAPSPDSTELVITSAAAPDRHVVRHGDVVSTHETSRVLEHVVSWVNHQVVDRAHDTVELHAAGLIAPEHDRTVLIAAPSGHGKTTLAAHLCELGWGYLSDEVIGLDRNGGVVGHPKPLTVKPGLREHLGISFDDGEDGGTGRRRWYVRPALLGGAVVRAAPAPTDLVFPEFDRSAGTARTALVEVEPHHALIELLGNTYRLERHGAWVLNALACIIESARVWRVRFADGRDAARSLTRVTASARPIEREVAVTAATAPVQQQGGGPRRSPGTVMAAYAGAGAVLYDQRRSQAALLDPIGALVWQLLDGTCAPDDVASELSSHFDADAHDITNDVGRLCAELESHGFLVS